MPQFQTFIVALEARGRSQCVLVNPAIPALNLSTFPNLNNKEKGAHSSAASCASTISSRTACMMVCIFITADVASSRPARSSLASFFTCGYHHYIRATPKKYQSVHPVPPFTMLHLT